MAKRNNRARDPEPNAGGSRVVEAPPAPAEKDQAKPAGKGPRAKPGKAKEA